MADQEEYARRRWLLLVMKSDKPVEQFQEAEESLDRQYLAINEDAIESHPLRDWLRAT